MILKGKLKTYFCLGMIGLMGPAGVLADTPATQCSYSVRLDEAKLVFVMIATKEDNECLSQGPEKLKAATAIRKRYKTSGLYSDNKSEPLWTVDWFSYQVFLSSNGKYLVRTGPWATKGADEAISFFSDGKLIRSYDVSDIVRNISALPHSVSHFEWEKHLDINPLKTTLEVTTLEGGRLTFNLLDGKMNHQGFPVLR